MAKVTIHHEATPEQPAKPSDELVHVADATGRKLGLRRLPFLEEFRIIEALGAELSSNTTYMGMLNPLLYLAEIDGEPVAIPRTKAQAEILIQRAGREGFLAVIGGITKHFAADEDAFKAKVKNG